MSLIYHTGKVGTKRLFYNEYTSKIGASLSEVYKNNKIDFHGLSWFLEIGYIPGNLTLFEGIYMLPHGAEIEMTDDNPSILKKFSYEDLINTEEIQYKDDKHFLSEGHTVFLEAVSKLYATHSENNIITLTSGLDSRLILGALLECTTSDNINAFTWGEPGSYDYEISKKISKRLGIKHNLIDISAYKLTEQRLIDFAIRSDGNVTLFDHWPYDELAKVIGKNPIWMGLMGGAASGSNIPSSAAEDPFSFFFQANNRIPSVTSLSASLLGIRPSIHELKELSKNFRFVNHDILDLYFHHERLISHIKLFNDLNYVLPFGEPKVLSFFLSLPAHLRRGRSLLKDMIIQQYPVLASFPSNRTHGLPLNLSGWKKNLATKIIKILDRRINDKKRKYLNVRDKITDDQYYKNLFIQSLRSLQKRNIMKNNNIIDILLDEHFGKSGYKINHESALSLLVSLEFILRSINYQEQQP